LLFRLTSPVLPLPPMRVFLAVERTSSERRRTGLTTLFEQRYRDRILVLSVGGTPFERTLWLTMPLGASTFPFPALCERPWEPGEDFFIISWEVCPGIPSSFPVESTAGRQEAVPSPFLSFPVPCRASTGERRRIVFMGCAVCFPGCAQSAIAEVWTVEFGSPTKPPTPCVLLLVTLPPPHAPLPLHHALDGRFQIGGLISWSGVLLPPLLIPRAGISSRSQTRTRSFPVLTRRFRLLPFVVPRPRSFTPGSCCQLGL